MVRPQSHSTLVARTQVSSLQVSALSLSRSPDPGRPLPLPHSLLKSEKREQIWASGVCTNSFPLTGYLCLSLCARPGKRNLSHVCGRLAAFGKARVESGAEGNRRGHTVRLAWPRLSRPLPRPRSAGCVCVCVYRKLRRTGLGFCIQHYRTRGRPS